MSSINLLLALLCSAELFRFRTNLYKLREEREISPKAFANLVSHVQYSRRWGPYFVEPIVAGLGGAEGDEPFICSMDVIGCINWAKDFVVSGTASSQLYGICEAYYEPDMEPEQLFECVSQCLMNAVDRDALSGWGAVVHIMYIIIIIIIAILILLSKHLSNNL